MKLEELLGEELYKQVEEKINAANANEPDKLKHIRYADLSEGEYVSKGKYDTAVAEKENLAGQVKTLNTTIDDLKKNNADNETLQNTITDLQTKLKDQQVANEQTDNVPLSYLPCTALRHPLRRPAFLLCQK